MKNQKITDKYSLKDCFIRDFFLKIKQLSQVELIKGQLKQDLQLIQCQGHLKDKFSNQNKTFKI